ncbi:PadR family transcriptional regulator [Cryobacterium sp. TMT2-10]|nr:PadR family transcriptional regulator [Cryobacterium sp. TMT2-10]
MTRPAARRRARSDILSKVFNRFGGPMSVRCGLLAILTIGPAYGFQLHGELGSRTGGRRHVNVGQIYATLDRLLKQGAIESAGATPDGLPLYRNTALGRSEALAWLHDTDSASGEEWNDLVDRVLIASSLPHSDARDIIASYRDRWRSGIDSGAVGRDSDPQSGTGQDRLAVRAQHALACAALSWLDEADARLGDGPADAFRHGLSTARPRRGRRPAAAPV